MNIPSTEILHEHTLEELRAMCAGFIEPETTPDIILSKSAELVSELRDDDAWNLLNYLHAIEIPIPDDLQHALLVLKDSQVLRVRRSFYRLIGKGKLSIDPLVLALMLNTESDPVAQSLIVDGFDSLETREVLPLLKARLSEIDNAQNDELFLVKKSLEKTIASLLTK